MKFLKFKISQNFKFLHPNTQSQASTTASATDSPRKKSKPRSTPSSPLSPSPPPPPSSPTQKSTHTSPPSTGAGDNNLSLVADQNPQAGFEAVLLALYAHETLSLKIINKRDRQWCVQSYPNPLHPNHPPI